MAANYSQFNIFRSQTASTPVLNGNTGSLISVLDYCLVSGSGWIKSFSSSSNGTGSRAVYRQPTGSLFYLNIQDDSILTAKEARIWGFETASAQDTGSGPFPSSSAGAAGSLGAGNGYLIARKSANTGSLRREWICFSDSMSMYFLAATGDTVGSYYTFAFGDFYSLKTSSMDNYRCMICGRTSENISSAGVDSLENLSALNSLVLGFFLARSSSAAPAALNAGKHGDATKGSATTMIGVTQYPNMPDNCLYISPVWIHESVSRIIRGKMRGLYQILHPRNRFSDGESFGGTNNFSSNSFQLVVQGNNGGVYCFDTSPFVQYN